MIDNVVKFNGHIRLDIKAADMLRAIAEENPANAFVIVWPQDGGMPTYHSSTCDTPVILMRLAEFQHKLFNGDFK